MPHGEMARPLRQVVSWVAAPPAYSGEAPTLHYQKLLAAMPWRRIGVLVRAGARQLAVGRTHAGYQLDR
jgi:hypothetical protein